MFDSALLESVARVVKQLDARGNPDLTGLPEILCRALKVQEESGELAQAVIGVLGQNPRKGITHTWDDVILEAIDVAMTALVFAYTIRRDELGDILRERLEYLADRAAKSGAPAVTS